MEDGGCIMHNADVINGAVINWGEIVRELFLGADW